MTAIVGRSEKAAGDRAPSPALEARPTRPVVWWAVVGGFFAALQLYIYAMWILSGDATPTHTGPDPVPTATKVWAWTFQGAMVVLVGVVLVHCFRQNRREGRFSFDSMLCVGFLSVFWQDSLTNYLRPNFFYNSYLLNLGSWYPHIPGWVSANANYLPEPLVFSTGVYAWWFVGFAMAFCWSARKARNRWPDISRLKLFLLGVVTLTVLDAVVEGPFMRAGLYAYPSAIRRLTMFGGETFQYPVYEGVFVGVLCAGIGLIRLGRDDHGRSAIDRGVDSLNVSTRQRAVVGTLAFVGLANVMFVGLNLAYIWTALYADPQPKYPSYMVNDMCGQPTYPCPDRNVPLDLNPENVGTIPRS